MAHQVKVLVVVDPSKQQHPALDKALLLANHAAGDISVKMVFLLTPSQQSTSESSSIMVESEWIKENIYSRMIEGKMDFSVLLGWGNGYNDVILDASNELQPTLTLMPYYSDKSIGRVFSDERWKLLRNANNPILITSQSEREFSLRMLCAFKTQDPEHEERNKRIAEVAQRFSATFGLEAHAVNAYDNSMEFPDRTKISAMSGIKNENVHVTLGEPEDVICDTANEIDADLIILASQQRKGWKGALRGNTIEKILERLDRDILMI